MRAQLLESCSKGIAGAGKRSAVLRANVGDTFVITPGVEMGRPGRIEVELLEDAALVSGTAVPIHEPGHDRPALLRNLPSDPLAAALDLTASAQQRAFQATTMQSTPGRSWWLVLRSVARTARLVAEAVAAMPLGGKLNARSQLGHGNCRDHEIVIFGNDLHEPRPSTER